MKVIFAEKAVQDLEAIVTFISGDNEARAYSFVDELQQRCLSLAEFPNRFPLVAGQTDTHVRKLNHGGYLIFYTVQADAVAVMRVLHGSMDYEAILFN